MATVFAAVVVCLLADGGDISFDARSAGDIAQVKSASTGPASGLLRLKLATTGNNMLGWTDLSKSEIFGLADYLVGIPVAIPPHKWGKGWILEFLCNNFANLPPTVSCTAFMFMYRCKPCNTPTNYELMGQLLLEGWDHVPCAGFFHLDKTASGAAEHHLSAMHIEVLLDTSVTVRIYEDIEFLFWGKYYKSETCFTQGTKAECDQFSRWCVWNGMECKPKSCRRHDHLPYGPSNPPCQVCVDDEQHLIRNQQRRTGN